MNAQPAAIVVAFDGLVAETHAARTLAIIDALGAEGTPVDPAEIAPMVLGRSLDETVDAVLQADARTRGAFLDHTVRDLTVLRARRAYSAIVAHGLPFRVGAAAWIDEQVARGVRVVLRADSIRADVEPLLHLSGLGDVVTFTRCADDLPRTRGAGSTADAWRAISSRLLALRIDPASCGALEASAIGAEAARGHVDDVQVMSLLPTSTPSSRLVAHTDD